ncbi:hypothetical protein BDY21DRAFT_86383 [Lineolata rhizophorae]|uniref:Uncharacterized protein n=1 Tax=Lineolata rhizophorae TaxID=578093 RepID=A0A6A6PBU2_9PEZI|nr:hypothetical protein BDY21DRAFT_86383 [Lineolata rhizophorae]
MFSGCSRVVQVDVAGWRGWVDADGRQSCQSQGAQNPPPRRDSPYLASSLRPPRRAIPAAAAAFWGPRAARPPFPMRWFANCVLVRSEVRLGLAFLHHHRPPPPRIAVTPPLSFSPLPLAASRRRPSARCPFTRLCVSASPLRNSSNGRPGRRTDGSSSQEGQAPPEPKEVLLRIAARTSRAHQLPNGVRASAQPLSSLHHPANRERIVVPASSRLRVTIAVCSREEESKKGLG